MPVVWKPFQISIPIIFILFSIVNAENKDSPKATVAQKSSKIDWKSQDFLKLSFPKNLRKEIEEGSCYKLEPKTVKIGDVDVNMIESEPIHGRAKNKSILLLHALRLSSVTWKDKVSSLQTLACLGYSVKAVDLPGHGKTPQTTSAPPVFLQNLINALYPTKKPVVVSPSFSGKFTLPNIVNHPELFSGFVPIAPSSVSSYVSDYPSVMVPTLIVCGEEDRHGIRSSKLLESIPTSSKTQILPSAGHSGYIQKPNMWHKLLYNFMELI